MGFETRLTCSTNCMFISFKSVSDSIRTAFLNCLYNFSWGLPGGFPLLKLTFHLVLEFLQISDAKFLELHALKELAPPGCRFSISGLSLLPQTLKFSQYEASSILRLDLVVYLGLRLYTISEPMVKFLDSIRNHYNRTWSSMNPYTGFGSLFQSAYIKLDRHLADP